MQAACARLQGLAPHACRMSRMAKRDTPGIDETRNCHLSFELTQKKIGSRSAVSIRARDQKKTIASTGQIQDRKSCVA